MFPEIDKQDISENYAAEEKCQKCPEEIEQSRTLRTDLNKCVRPTNVDQHSIVDTLDTPDTFEGNNCNTNNASKPVEPEVNSVQMPLVEWVPCSAIDEIKDLKRRSEIVSAFLKDDLHFVGVITWINPETNQRLLRKDTLE